MDLSYMSALPLTEFTYRRQKVFDKMQNNSTLLVFSSLEQKRNNDCYYPFRQDSYFWYLTGFNEPHSALLLIKKNNSTQSILFLRASDPLMEIWNGRRLGIVNAPNMLLIDTAYSIDDIESQFLTIIEGCDSFYYASHLQPWGDSILASIFEKLHKQPKLKAPNTLIDWRPIINEMRLFKSKNEIALIQQACQISAFAHIKAMQQTRANRFEYEIESEMTHEFNRFGARFPAYNPIIAGGENACILHYTENDQPLKEDDLVLIDAGCEFAMYAGDITRTFPVKGKFNQAQKEIYQIVLDAQYQAIQLLIPGNTFRQANDHVIKTKVAGLIDLGILQGDIEQLIENQAYKEFYMHNLGHWLGLDVHDVGDYGKNHDRILEPGMVITVEPGLYIFFSSNVPAQYKGIGVRIEDNLLITETGNKILTSAAPKTITDIEKLMAHQ